MMESKKQTNGIDVIEKKDFDLVKLYLLFRSEWKYIVYISALFVIIGLIYALLSTPWYRSKVKIMPTPSSESQFLSQYSNIAALAGINLGGEFGDNYNLYPEIVKSNFILERVLTHKFKTKLFDNPVTLFEFWETDIDSSKPNWKHKLFEEAKSKLREDYIKASIDKITNLLTISVQVPKDPVLAAELANYITDQLDIYNKKYRHYKAKEQRIFIEKSIEDTKQNLINAENALKIFLNNNKDLSSPETKLEYEKLNNELNLQRTLYLELKKQLELAKISEVKETETLNILEKAVVPVRRYKPKRLIILIIFSFIGFVLSLLFVMGKYFVKSFILALNEKTKK